ncbi:MAG: polyphenol oxidase family protein [Gemmatimonadota bacterium]|nr:polyphenol oxidase family protein [Gemmatimonadota bacterium]
MTSPFLASVEPIDDFAEFGITAFTTTRLTGSFGTATREPVCEVMERWSLLRDVLTPLGPRLATAQQVHGRRVVRHGAQWAGWLRVPQADGHAAVERGTAMAVTIADCVPIFLAHPSGGAALLHSGWRGTAARIIDEGVRALAESGLATAELALHLGPAICGRCYEVSPDVYAALTGRTAAVPTTVDLRVLIADRAREIGVRRIAISPYCTRCHRDRFYSHRAGDEGRQLAVMVAAE